MSKTFSVLDAITAFCVTHVVLIGLGIRIPPMAAAESLRGMLAVFAAMGVLSFIAAGRRRPITVRWNTLRPFALGTIQRALFLFMAIVSMHMLFDIASGDASKEKLIMDMPFMLIISVFLAALLEARMPKTI